MPVLCGVLLYFNQSLLKVFWGGLLYISSPVLCGTVTILNFHFFFSSVSISYLIEYIGSPLKELVLYINNSVFYWSIVNLQCCISFKCIAKWFSCTYILFQILFHYRLLQDIEYSYLCCTVSSCCLPILYIVVCKC